MDRKSRPECVWHPCLGHIVTIINGILYLLNVPNIPVSISLNVI